MGFAKSVQTRSGVALTEMYFVVNVSLAVSGVIATLWVRQHDPAASSRLRGTR